MQPCNAIGCIHYTFVTALTTYGIFILQPQNRAPLQLGAQNHMLRKVIEEGKENNFTLAAFLCFAEHSQFCILRPVRSDGQFSLKRLATVYAPEYDLIDYSVTPDGRIVALWTNPDGVPMLRYTHFDGNSATWTDVILESPLDPYFAPDDSQFDPRQVYLKQLFYPGRFSIQTLSKTVNVSEFIIFAFFHPSKIIYINFKLLSNSASTIEK